jgi:uncharacterized OB-fold protein
MELPSVEETLNDEDRPFFEGLVAGELRVPWCDCCAEGVWPPRARCPRCYRQVTHPRTLSGRGTVYSFSVVHRGDGPFADREPYIYAYVQLEGGPVIPANIVGPGSREVVIGAHVRLATHAPRDAGLATAAFVVAAR